MTQTNRPPSRLLTWAEVSEKLGGRSRSSLWRDVKNGFPAPVKIGRSIRWPEDAVDAHIAALQAGGGA